MANLLRKYGESPVFHDFENGKMASPKSTMEQTMIKRTIAAAVLVTALGGSLWAGSEPIASPQAQVGGFVAAVLDANTRDCVVGGAAVGAIIGSYGGPVGALGGAVLGAL